MNQIKNTMLESDVIVLTTPVYAASVSAQTKIFIDRIAYWLHLFRLIGKLGIPIVTSSNNSLSETIFYLKRIMLMLGLSVTDVVGFTTDFPNMIKDETSFEEELFKKAKVLSEYLKNPYLYKPHSLQEKGSKPERARVL